MSIICSPGRIRSGIFSYRKFHNPDSTSVRQAHRLRSLRLSNPADEAKTKSPDTMYLDSLFYAPLVGRCSKEFEVNKKPPQFTCQKVMSTSEDRE